MSIKKTRKLSHEIVGVLAITLFISLFLFQILFLCGGAIADNYCASRDWQLTEEQMYVLESWVLNLSILITVIFFMILFLFLLGERLSYIREIIKGIEALQSGQMDYVVAPEGNNELTRLAESINYLSKTQQEVKEKERVLSEEKEQLIRTLSHDIRTPLTSILSYSELMQSEDAVTKEEQKAYVELVQKKAGQIKELTDVLLEGGRRNLEMYEDGKLLMMQLVEEFEESLEEAFELQIDMNGCTAFSGVFDVQELRRIFDNVSSNILKYADPRRPVVLSVTVEDGHLVIKQSNGKVKKQLAAEGYQIGLSSIKRIAHSYEGQVQIVQDVERFEIYITLSLKS